MCTLICLRKLQLILRSPWMRAIFGTEWTQPFNSFQLPLLLSLTYGQLVHLCSELSNVMCCGKDVSFTWAICSLPVLLVPNITECMLFCKALGNLYYFSFPSHYHYVFLMLQNGVWYCVFCNFYLYIVTDMFFAVCPHYSNCFTTRTPRAMA